MSDETKIEPALSAEEWKRREVRLGPEWWDSTLSFDDESVSLENGSDPQESPRALKGRHLAAVIAAANAALPDNDPRKITRLRVRLLRWAAEDVLGGLFARVEPHRVPVLAQSLRNMADALESYLPPEASDPALTVERGGLSALPPDLERKLRESL